MGCRREGLARRLYFAVLHCNWGDEECVVSAIEWALAAGGCGPRDLAVVLGDPRVSGALERVGVSVEDLLERSLGDSRFSAFREALVEAVESGAVTGGGGLQLLARAGRGGVGRRGRRDLGLGLASLAWRLGGLASGVLGGVAAGIMAGKAYWMLGVALQGGHGFAVGAGLVFSAASAAAYAGSAAAGLVMLFFGASGLGVMAGRAALLLALAGLAFSLLAAPVSPP